MPQPTTPQPSSNTSQYPNQRPNLASRPVSGNVTMEDGTAPLESVRVESVCGGRATILAYTDSHGGFSATTTPSQFSDARTPGPRSTTRGGSMGPGVGGGLGSGTACVLRASLPGYRSTEINMAFLTDSFDPVTLILHPMGVVEGRTVSATSLAAPKDARAAFEKAGTAIRKRKWDDAQGYLEKAVKSYPRYAEAWSDLGKVYTVKNERDQARKAYQEAVALDPKFVSPYFGLAELAMHEQKWREMAEHTDTLLKLNAYDFPGAYAYDAMAHLNLNQLDEAEKSARQGIKIDDRGDVPKNHHLLGVILMRKGEYQAAAEQLNKYLEAEPGGPDEEFVRRQIAACEARQAARGPAPGANR